MTEKTCTICGVTKSIESFRRTGRGGRYRRNACRVCDSSSHGSWAKRNKKHLRRTAKAWRSGPGRFKQALHNSKASAKREGYAPCSATEKEIEDAFVGTCHVCGIPERESDRKLSMDHCHETGAFRGWLCGKCNSALGLLRDSEEVIANLLDYIERN